MTPLSLLIEGIAAFLVFYLLAVIGTQIWKRIVEWIK